MTEEPLFERASCGLAVVSDNGTIQRCNRTLLSWIGYEAEALIGVKRFQELLTTPGRMFYLTHIDPLLRMQGFVNEIACRLKCADGRTISMYLNFGLEHNEGEPGRIHISFFRGKDRAKYEEELRAAKARAEHLSAIVESSIDAIVSTDLNGIVLTSNPGFHQIFQYRNADVIGRNLCELICSPEKKVEHVDMLDRARRKANLSQETVRLRRDGTPVYVSLSMSPIKNDFQEVIAVSVIYRDITERMRAAEHIDLLMHEVNHRSKNLLSVVQGVARRTARHTHDVARFIESFSARLSAIAASHDLLVSREWKGIELHELARKQLGHLGESIESQVELQGDAIVVTPRAAEAIGLALHELSTNAVKYGALSTDAGRICLSWQSDPVEATFSLTWTEENGPPVINSGKKGFGSAVLGKMVPRSIHGTAELEYASRGISYRLRTKIDHIVAC